MLCRSAPLQEFSGDARIQQITIVILLRDDTPAKIVEIRKPDASFSRVAIGIFVSHRYPPIPVVKNLGGKLLILEHALSVSAG